MKKGTLIEVIAFVGLTIAFMYVNFAVRSQYIYYTFEILYSYE